MKIDDKYDVIIIGAGIGGLICGTRLAKEGLNVLIIEKHEKPGGCVTSCRKKGFNFDYGAHMFGSCNNTGILGYYLKELNIRDINFLRINPSFRFFFSDQVIEVPQDIEEYITSLKSKYPKEAMGLDLFFKEVIKIARSYSSDALLVRYKNLTFESLLKKYFKDKKLMSILSAQFRYLGTPLKTLAATSMCLMMTSYLRDGVYYPEGGTQNFSDSLSNKFKTYGGTILLRKEVTKIIIKNNMAKGVIANYNEIYKSNIVISNGDAIKTFFNLIGEDNIDSVYLKKIKGMEIGSSFFMTFLGVRDNINLKNKDGWYHSSYELNSEHCQSMYIFIPSLFDISLAPKNMHVIELAIPFRFEFMDIKDWSICKKSLEDELLNKVEKIIPGLKNSIIFKESATPKTIERFTNNSHGSICGWRMSVDQVHEKRPSSSTPIEGLYLTGHWINPGCGVAPVATAGWIAANKILQNLNMKKKTTVLYN